MRETATADMELAAKSRAATNAEVMRRHRPRGPPLPARISSLFFKLLFFHLHRRIFGCGGKRYHKILAQIG
jgi:hypothetical protein